MTSLFFIGIQVIKQQYNGLNTCWAYTLTTPLEIQGGEWKTNLNLEIRTFSGCDLVIMFASWCRQDDN